MRVRAIECSKMFIFEQQRCMLRYIKSDMKKFTQFNNFIFTGDKFAEADLGYDADNDRVHEFFEATNKENKNIFLKFFCCSPDYLASNLIHTVQVRHCGIDTDLIHKLQGYLKNITNYNGFSYEIKEA